MGEDRPTGASRSDRVHLKGWGGAVGSDCELVRARSADDVRAAFRRAAESGRTVAFRGAGCSYGDAALNRDGIVVDLTPMNRILAFDRATGDITAEPGVTIKDLWEAGIPEGFWPPVVPGTMFPTLGGCLAMNIHGKNSFRVGTIGDHVRQFDLMLVSGEIVTCSHESHPDLFRCAIGGFGMLGCFVSITLKLKKVPGGRLRVSAFAPGSLAEMISTIERESATADYLVGWIDGFARGASLGRGIVHRADHAGPDWDQKARATLALSEQHLPSRVLGVFPKGWVWRLMRPFMGDLGMRVVNALKFHSGRSKAAGAAHLQSHSQFAFLHDYVPDWKRAYGSGGLIQYQSFVPAAAALEVHTAMLRASQSAGLHPYLLVYKRHRADSRPLTHAVDGYSMAMDFKVTPTRRSRLWELCADFDRHLAQVGGRGYFAKDATMTPAAGRAIFPDSEMAEFLGLKRRVDPMGVLRSDLFARVFAGF